MKTILAIFSMAVLFLITPAILAQKAIPVEINGLLAKIPAVHNSEDNFHVCTTVTDHSNNTVSVKDAGTAHGRRSPPVGWRARKMVQSGYRGAG